MNAGITAAEKPVSWKERLAMLGMLPRILRLVWACHPVYAILLGLLTLSVGILPTGHVWVRKLIVDQAVPMFASGEFALWVLAPLILTEIGLEIASMVLEQFKGYVQEVFGDRFANRMQRQVLEKAVTLDLSFFENAAYYDRLQRAQRDAFTRPMTLLTQVFDLLRNAVSALSLFVLVVFSNWQVVGVILLVAIPGFWVQVRFSGRQYALWNRRSPEQRQVSYLSLLLTTDWYAKEIKLFGLAPYLLKKHRALLDKFHLENRRLTGWRTLASSGARLVSLFGFYAVIAYVLYLAFRRVITLGDMAMYYQAFGKMQGNIRGILANIASMYEQSLFLTNLFAFLDLQPRLTNGKMRNAPALPMPGEIAFRDVSFQYDGTDSPVLTHIDFSVSPGETIALVGENGAGKTTLIKLLAGLYDPSEGAILIDGRDLRTLDREAHMTRIGVIFQDFARYQLPVKENIGFGDVAALENINQIAAAARQGGAEAFIRQLPNGYETMLGKWFDGGMELSLGQWQKIALARAFMSDAQILVLDEPTASVDVETEYEIYERFHSLTKGKIAFLISHRFSTVRMADRTLVLEKGRLVEEGTHAALLALGGRYARLFDMQAQWYR